MTFCDYWEDEILDHVMMQGDYSSPTAIWVALSTADPTDDGSSLTEPSSGYGYARVETSAGHWNAASSGLITNAVDITFAEATSDWGTITHFELRDASSAGNALANGALDSNTDVNSGATAKFSAGDLSVSLD